MSNTPQNNERSFLEGPRSRWQELKYVFSVVVQFVKGFRALHFVGPCITVFGSARFKEDHPYYQLTVDVSAALSKMGFAIMTGGGPGLMEAANRGAREAGGLSLGCNIVLPMEQVSNPYLDKYVNFDSFFVRKELLRKYSFAFIVMPGGFGTMDELFETLTLIQTKKISNFPIVIMGTEYHKDLMKYLEHLAAAKAIDESDLDLVLFTDDVEAVVAHIGQYSSQKLKAAPKPSKILLEAPVHKQEKV
jgi:uncharacterized protein (TIGR00730 family)